MTGPEAGNDLRRLLIRAASAADLFVLGTGPTGPTGRAGSTGPTERIRAAVVRSVCALGIGPAAVGAYRRQTAVNHDLVAALAGGPIDVELTGVEARPAWNRAAVDALRFARDGAKSSDDSWSAHQHLASIAGTPDPSRAGGGGGGGRLGRRVGTRLADRQDRFQAAFLDAVRAAYGLDARPHQADTDAYRQWLAEREPAQAADLEERLARLVARPLISVVVPTYETPEDHLRACIASVAAQRYDRLELCVADDGSRSPTVHRVLHELAAAESRIKLAFLPENAGISAATNAALALATGEYVAFLDHDDVLPPGALAEVACHLDEHPGTDVVYSDEDRISRDGLRIRPFFKPDWSPDLLDACNYLRHLLVARRELVEAVGGARTAFDGAQDYDLILRLTERAARIGHVPRVLYHWREAPGSLSGGSANKPLASANGADAVRDHLRRVGPAGATVTNLGTHYRIHYEVPPGLRISVVVVCRPGDGGVGLTLDSGLSGAEIIVVGDEADAAHAAGTDGPTALRNEGALRAIGDVLVFVDAGLEPADTGWLRELAAQAWRPEIGVVGARIVFPDRAIEHAGVLLQPGGAPGRPFAGLVEGWTTAGNVAWPRNYVAVGAGAMAIRADVFRSVGGFDPTLGPAAVAIDLCVRVRATGRRVLYAPHAVLVRRAPAPPDDDPGTTVGVALDEDPYFNPNLSPTKGDGSLAPPPGPVPGAGEGR